MILIYGISFGILSMTIIYTFIRYIYSKEIFYISYCFMQVFSLIYLLSYSELFAFDFLIKDGSMLFASISAIVFAVSFYEGKFLPKITNQKELFINTLLLNVVILTCFYHYVLFEYLPYTIVYGILFISIIFNLKQGFKPTLVYVIGWSIFCLLLFIFDFKSYYSLNGYFDLVLVAFAIEAILFTISVSYRYGSMKKQMGEYESMLLQQSKLAKTGEMIGNITHQFRQPLNNLAYILINMKKKYEKNALDERYFGKKYTQANEQIKYLSKTIDDFKEFYTPSKVKEDFSVKESIENVLSILSSEIKRKQISLKLEFLSNENIKVEGIKNELSQGLLALLSNSIEAFKDVQNPFINIKVSSNSSIVSIHIQDNAGGIKKQNLNKIFEPYFSTKQEGTGIGLYLVKHIVEKTFEGSIEVENKQEGVEFTLNLAKSI